MVFRMYARWVAVAPFSSQVVVASTTTALADYVVQKTSKPEEKPNISRIAGFGLFGAVYLGVAQHVMYVNLFSRLFGRETLEAFGAMSLRDKLNDRSGLINVGKQLVLDFLVVQPVIFWPAYYSTRALVDTQSVAKIPEYLGTYKKNFVEDNVGMCAFWLPADTIIYSLPLRWRLHASHL
eukprot:CAMPEP_0182475960 /NCGR_PEP_ID=MMETSP1319-20130603/28239_1 /TAXON_ID=172717 /ORGANISM="Bolidomonas pacifica, Strain RCC208" /LENGTH=179 /DNA_ID=CAMNT_0024677003 /DNA_START=72 /DNA_END=608 /DNA_ORIENTATION=-